MCGELRCEAHQCYYTRRAESSGVESHGPGAAAVWCAAAKMIIRQLDHKVTAINPGLDLTTSHPLKNY